LEVKMNKCLRVFILVLILLTNGYALSQLTATFSKGKTYITWDEDTSGVRYKIYRSTTPILSLNGLTPIAEVNDSSSYHKYLKIYYVAQDLATPLTDNQGLYVYTPKHNSKTYYAVTTIRNGVEDVSLSDLNSLQNPVSESYWSVPGAVLRSVNVYYGYSVHLYDYWSDDETWPKEQSYWNTLQPGGTPIIEPNCHQFTVTVPPLSTRGELTRFPVETNLHSLGYSGWSAPATQFRAGIITVDFRDHQRTFFTGATGDRVLSCMKAFRADPRFLDSLTDTTRWVLKGISMGACGSYRISGIEPTLFSVINPVVSQVVSAQYQLYDFAKLSMLDSFPSIERPPLVDLCAVLDSKEWNLNAHRLVYKSYTLHRQGFWGRWLNAEHGYSAAIHPTGEAWYDNWREDDHVPGETFRFKTNEAYPAFGNGSLNDNYGLADTTIIDSSGRINGWVDWCSSLHDLALSNDDLIDNIDTFSMTFKSDTVSVTIDITPRRIQAFKHAPGTALNWKSFDIQTGQIIDNGIVVVDSFALFTINRLLITPQGCRLVVTKDNNVAAFSLGNTCSRSTYLTTSPNPFCKTASISVSGEIKTGAAIGIYNSTGQKIRQYYAKEFMGKQNILWDGNNGQGVNQSSGIYLVKLFNGGKSITSRLIKL
jgi:hypothetical protein